MVFINKRELGLKFFFAVFNIAYPIRVIKLGWLVYIEHSDTEFYKVDDLKYSRLTYGDRGAFSINNLGYKFLKTSLKT